MSRIRDVFIRCPICNADYPDELYQQHKNNCEISCCRSCNAKFISRDQYVNHIMYSECIDPKDEKHTCPHCHSKFGNKRDIRLHLPICYLDDRDVIKCPTCNAEGLKLMFFYTIHFPVCALNSLRDLEHEIYHLKENNARLMKITNPFQSEWNCQENDISSDSRGCCIDSR